MSLFSSLANTRSSFKKIFSLTEKLSQEQLEVIEGILLQADCGTEVTDTLVLAMKNYKGDDWQKELKKQITAMISIEDIVQPELKSNQPYTIILTGVNGAGKTTTIAKLAHLPKFANKKILFASADTFRAAANEQLEDWAKKSNAEIFRGSLLDPSAVIYTALEKAIAKQFDVLIVDTAGRQFNQQNLMKELEKMNRTMKKFSSDYPHENLLVVDASSGQNAVHQAKAFLKIMPMTGCIVTKLDGTAKGGMILSLIHELKLPIKYLGIGEKPEDIVSFDASNFADGLVTL